MFKIEELAGSLIRSGRFHEAIPMVMNEIRIALHKGVITEDEIFNPINGIPARLAHICLNPSRHEDVKKLANDLLSLAMRSGLVALATDYEENVKKSREAI